MVDRIYTEKKISFRSEANGLKKDIENTLKINPTSLRVINRYDVEGLTKEALENTILTVFSEPPVDDNLSTLPISDQVFAIEYLPGQTDQRADNARECISFIYPDLNVKVKTAKVYLIDGITKEETEIIKNYLINPVEAREASLDVLDTLEEKVTQSEEIGELVGFIDLDESGLKEMLKIHSLAMDEADIKVFQDYFKSKDRNPTYSELKVCDTYWSDHCRHTTFLTELDNIEIRNKEVQKSFKNYLNIKKEINNTKPITLMDVATIGAKYLKKKGLATKIDESEEINACSINVDVKTKDQTIPYLLMFKNETHNHPTEIEPFGGAATCIGGAIRDPLSGRSFVYQGLRVSGCSDPREKFEDTLKGKLPQRKIAQTATKGFSSYGNQIGLTTGLVDEIYHPGYKAKHMETGAVMAAIEKSHVRREVPQDGDLVILLGGRTGRDGIGGATGSSKSHETTSTELCGSEVQKGCAPEERKLNRLFRKKEFSTLVKRCNDFGAGGICVAIGELADGLEIYLDNVKKKYLGLSGTELIISESQERMAVVVSKADSERVIREAEKENLEATIVAKVTANPVLNIIYKNETIVSLDRFFLDTTGAKRKTDVIVEDFKEYSEKRTSLEDALSDLNICSKEGLSENFDSTIGSKTVLFPFGGKYNKTPPLAAVAKIPCEKDTTTCSLMSYAYDPYHTNQDPYNGAFENVVNSVCKLIATGSTLENTYLSFQEYFAKASTKEKWGNVLSALLGALDAQLTLGVAAIGGKDSMSGSFENLDVPNTLISFAVNTANIKDIRSPEFKKPKSYVYLIQRSSDLKKYLEMVSSIVRKETTLSASLVLDNRIDTTISKMCFGNKIGFKSTNKLIFTEPFSFIIESSEELSFTLLGKTKKEEKYDDHSLSSLLEVYEKPLSEIYPLRAKDKETKVETFTFEKKTISYMKDKKPLPRVLIPVFPGTNCEDDTKKAFEKEGCIANVFVINNLNGDKIKESIYSFTKELKNSEILFLPGGFSGQDEPDGSAKFITSFLRNPSISDEIMTLLRKRDGLVGGICNGFQALIKLGLIPYGEFKVLEEDSPTLTFNTISRHVSKLSRIRISNATSPWLSQYNEGDVQIVPISHGEGRIVLSDSTLSELVKNGQIATQYVNNDDKASMKSKYNPNGSMYAIEGLTSPCFKVFGRMAHSERCQEGLYKNVLDNASLSCFKGAVEYFK